MATATGTATDYLDLLERFNTFVTGLGGGAAWTALRNVTGEKIWSAPGGGADQIIVGAKSFFNVGADYYNWRLGGFLAFDAGLAFENQSGYVGIFSGVAAPSPVLNLWNSAIPYRFYASGRRAIILAKVSSVYVAAYLGFLSTYVSPGSWPYPLVVGGSMAWTAEPAATSANWRWSYAGAEIANFPIPRVIANPFDSSLRVRLPSGVWMGIGKAAIEVRANLGKVWPYSNVGIANAPDWRDDLGGGYMLLPVVLADGIPNVYGELDGVFALTGFGNGAENTVTIGGVSHYVVQNVFRTDQLDYFAIKEA
jgi:hypothetical protein